MFNTNRCGNEIGSAPSISKQILEECWALVAKIVLPKLNGLFYKIADFQYPNVKKEKRHYLHDNNIGYAKMFFKMISCQVIAIFTLLLYFIHPNNHL